MENHSQTIKNHPKPIKSIPKPPKGPYPPKSNEEKVSEGNNAVTEAKVQDVIDEDGWLMDDDQHEASKREKSRQSQKAGVEVDENFADEAWDESSMEASKS